MQKIEGEIKETVTRVVQLMRTRSPQPQLKFISKFILSLRNCEETGLRVSYTF